MKRIKVSEHPKGPFRGPRSDSRRKEVQTNRADATNINKLSGETPKPRADAADASGEKPLIQEDVHRER